MPEGSSSPVFLDTVTLSNFALAGRVDLLVARLGGRLCVTTQVEDEIAAGIVSGHRALRAVEEALTAGQLRRTSLRPKDRVLYRELIRTLGSGEASCVAGAADRGGIVGTDDRAARQACAEHGIPVTGTVGILLACCRDHALRPEEADRALAQMVRQGFHAPVTSITGLL